MNKHVPDCLITGYESLIPTVTLPDADDRHVLAAAIHGGVGVILTFNLSDFPKTALQQFGIKAAHPDEFVVRLLDQDLEAVLSALRLHRASLTRPAKTVAEYLKTLEQCQLSETVDSLRPHSRNI
jgi:hypothetical protein